MELIEELEFREAMDHERESFIIIDRVDQIRDKVNEIIKMHNDQIKNKPTPPPQYRGHLGDFDHG